MNVGFFPRFQFPLPPQTLWILYLRLTLHDFLNILCQSFTGNEPYQAPSCKVDYKLVQTHDSENADCNGWIQKSRSHESNQGSQEYI